MDDEPKPFYLYYNDGYGRICNFNINNYPIQILSLLDRLFHSTEIAVGPQLMYAIEGNQIQVFNIVSHETGVKTDGNRPEEWHQGAAVGYFNNKLYYIGSYDENNGTSRVQTYDGENWSRQVDGYVQITGNISQHAIVHESHLYILDIRHRRTIARLSNDEINWAGNVGAVRTMRLGAAVVSLNGKIYVTGGTDGHNVMKSCETFTRNVVREQNMRIAKLRSKRCFHTLVVANGRIYAIGGYQTIDNHRLSDFCKDIEEYDPNENTWTIVAQMEEPSAILL